MNQKKSFRKVLLLVMKSIFIFVDLLFAVVMLLPESDSEDKFFPGIGLGILIVIGTPLLLSQILLILGIRDLFWQKMSILPKCCIIIASFISALFLAGFFLLAFLSTGLANFFLKIFSLSTGIEILKLFYSISIDPNILQILPLLAVIVLLMSLVLYCTGRWLYKREG